MKSILTGEKYKKTGEKGITLIALVVTIIVLLILAGVSIAMLTGQNGILRRAEEAGTNTAHAEVYETLNLQTADYMTESKLGEYNGSLIDYLLDKGYIEETGEEGKYLINVEALLGQKGKYGNGEGDIDVYKLEDALSTGEITKVAATSETTVSGASGVYNVIYYGKEGSQQILLGKIRDDNSDEIVFYVEGEEGEIPELKGPHKALRGMTWGEWLASKYRIAGFGVESDYFDDIYYDTWFFNETKWIVERGNIGGAIEDSEGNRVQFNSKIMENETYYVTVVLY